MSDSTEFRRRDREQLRGLFTLGLMAILITLRTSQTEIVFSFLNTRYIITGIIDLTLALWGVYAFMMIVSLSGDILPTKLCEMCYTIGIAFLVFSFLLFYITAIAFASNIPVYWNVLAVIAILSPVYYFMIRSFVSLYRRIRKFVER